MKMAVLVKQVPATDNIKIDPVTGVMQRDNLQSELNPLDTYAVEQAVRMKKNFQQSTVTAVSMGIPAAQSILRQAIAMGCDEGVLLSDRAFAGSDTWATAHVLAKGLQKLGGFDIIFAGERATDGETGQVGPCVAVQLDIPVLTFVSEVKIEEDGKILATRSVEGGYELLRVSAPVLISVVKEINEPWIPDYNGMMKAKSSSIKIMTAQDIGVDKTDCGLEGSPTRVSKVFYPKLTRNGEVFSDINPEKSAQKILDFLKVKNIL